jgi:hypothetical protein
MADCEVKPRERAACYSITLQEAEDIVEVRCQNLAACDKQHVTCNM